MACSRPSRKCSIKSVTQKELTFVQCSKVYRRHAYIQTFRPKMRFRSRKFTAAARASIRDRIRAAACLNLEWPVDPESRISIASHGMHAML